jgi:endonuclease/exonuclease/phosphatase (EEP) superfamily protein YafD
VLVVKAGRGSQMRFRVQLNPDVMPRLRVHDVYAGALKAHKIVKKMRGWQKASDHVPVVVEFDL